MQFRSLNFLAGPLQVRCVPEPECCHPCWNDFKRATKSAGLYATMVKATYRADLGAGPYNSGVGDIDLKVAASALMRDISEDAVAADEFWQAVLPEIAFRPLQQHHGKPNGVFVRVFWLSRGYG